MTVVMYWCPLCNTPHETNMDLVRHLTNKHRESLRLPPMTKRRTRKVA